MGDDRARRARVHEIVVLGSGGPCVEHGFWGCPVGCRLLIPLLGENGRLCSSCLEIKDKTLFGMSKSNEDGLNIWCKNCVNSVARSHKTYIQSNAKRDEKREEMKATFSIRCKFCDEGFINDKALKRHMRNCVQLIPLLGEKGKLCLCCLEIKDETLFGTSKSREDGLNIWFKDCVNSVGRRRYAHPSPVIWSSLDIPPTYQSRNPLIHLFKSHLRNIYFF